MEHILIGGRILRQTDDFPTPHFKEELSLLWYVTRCKPVRKLTGFIELTQISPCPFPPPPFTASIPFTTLPFPATLTHPLPNPDIQLAFLGRRPVSYIHYLRYTRYLRCICYLRYWLHIRYLRNIRYLRYDGNYILMNIISLLSRIIYKTKYFPCSYDGGKH